mgnify:FL=1
MNWHYTNPIVNGDYLCCVKGYSFPMPLTWHDGEWGSWTHGGWTPLVVGRSLKDDYSPVVCYTSFQEIPMPENW